MITAVMERLKAKTSITDIQTAEDLEALSNGVMPRNRTVFVLPFDESAGDNAFVSGTFRQSVVVRFLVAFFLRRYDDAKGDGRVTIFELMRDEIEKALAGWQWDEHEELVSFVGSRAGSSPAKGTSIFVQTWQTTRTLERS